MRESTLVVSTLIIVAFFVAAFKFQDNYSRPHGDCESQAANIAAMHSTIFDSNEHFNQVLQREIAFCHGR